MILPSSLNSEEAKSTTWLHPGSGEAALTGHRTTPGKVSLGGGSGSGSGSGSSVSSCSRLRGSVLGGL